MKRHIDIIATTISGSISDWGKVKRIVPLFKQHGETKVILHTSDSHREARSKTCELVRSGSRIVISAGGSGTFNAVMEGCHDADVDLSDLRLGFLRKGSADLIGKVLGMPDAIEPAIATFVQSIRENTVTPCDVIRASSAAGKATPRRFVGYGGAEIFGEIPHITENRYMKYYKGVLSQLFGDMGPFFVGASLTMLKRTIRLKKRKWQIIVDGQERAFERYQALILVNGDLGPNLPFAKGIPLGSGDFHLFAIRDLGWTRLPGQFKKAWDATIMQNPEQYGFKTYRIQQNLELKPSPATEFPLNVDGSILPCHGAPTANASEPST